MTALILNMTERRAIERRAKEIVNAAARLERHVMQNISRVEATAYISDIEWMLASIKKRLAEAREA